MLNLLFSKIYNTGTSQDNIYHTPECGREVYDSVVCRFNEDGKLYSNHIWEAKIRDANYPDILFEKEKYESLKKIQQKYDGAKCDIFYVSCHPDGTYIFNITKIFEKIEWKNEMHNRSTVELHRGKKMKTLTYLPISLAKRFDITVADIDRIEKEMEMKRKTKKVKKIGIDFDNVE